VRTTALAVLVVGLATVLGAALLLVSFREALLGELETSARLRTTGLAQEVGDEAGEEADRALGLIDAEDLVVQVVDLDGRVIASSPNVAGLPLIARPAPDDAEAVRLPVDPGSYLVVSEEISTPAGNGTLIVGVSTEGVDDSTRSILVLVAVGLPAMLLVVAATGWAVVGRALAPVEEIRRKVAGISAAELHRRVPEPAADDEIGRLASTMNAMLGRLEEAQLRQRRFVSDASHELRTPIATIRQHAEVALAHPDRSSLHGLASTVLAEDLRIQHLVSDLLLLAATDERNAPRRERPVDLDDLVFAVAGDLRAELRADRALRVDTSAVSAGRVLGDEAGLRRVVSNLAENAGRHARSRIDLSLTTRNGQVVLTVDDDGPGIPEPDRERVLERFVRLDTARARESGGSGLGLAIVAQVAAAHGGDVAIEQSPIGGTRVRVRLPAASGDNCG
jgi:signal transduction histidine kinase